MKAERRTAVGRNQVAQLRSKGWMPAVVYGEGGENISIAISEWELDRHVKFHHKVYTLDIEGSSETALLQDVAWHTLTDRPMHADFMRIDLDKPIESDLEVTLVGHAAGLSKGGALVKDQLVLRIKCLPTAMPEGFEHDISRLEIEDRVTVGDLEQPEGVEFLTPAETSVCHVIKAVVAVEEPEAGEGADAGGDGADGDGGDATPPGPDSGS